VGLKVNCSWQSALAANCVALHVLLAIAKGGVMKRLVIGTGVRELLPAATWNKPEVAPTATGGELDVCPGEGSKLIAAGARLTGPVAVPVPLNDTVNCPP
jgi:hypothetical protein